VVSESLSRDDSEPDYYQESGEEAAQDGGLMVWDDDEVYIPAAEAHEHGSPRVEEIGQRNSLVFSTQDAKEQYHMLMRVSKDRGTMPGVIIKSTEGVPKLKRRMSAGKRSDPGKKEPNQIKPMFMKTAKPPLLPKPNKDNESAPKRGEMLMAKAVSDMKT
jgi:hypothetical protein